MARKEIKVDARVGRTSSSAEGVKPVRLTITDKASGIEFLAVHFTDEEWGRVCSGSSTQDGAEAEVGGLQYVGLTHEHQSKAFGGYGKKSNKDFGRADAEVWGKQMLADGWDTVSYSRNNKGETVAIVRRYV